ncbi:MBL fold metallo-hydrolase [Pseudenhygromyxa sp. WMMC2535]|uniref:MBL fold metallo-hydrolase n=1 Tax=Pseudenhygromyxa sp. WMMC2535 TaxID=2712867 RepID=UPI0015519E99|nr:MBL fold metallo-hydrolase [Pseudenhygromyxa sp. WMMC2535]
MSTAELRYHRYSFFEYRTLGTSLFMDPAFSRYRRGAWVGSGVVDRCDIVAVTSGDFDHYCDAIDVLLGHDPQLVASVDICRAIWEHIERKYGTRHLNKHHFIGLEDQESANNGRLRLTGYRVEPWRLQQLWLDFLRRPEDITRLGATLRRTPQHADGLAFVIEMAGRRIAHLGCALHPKTNWSDIRTIASGGVDLVVCSANADYVEELVRGVSILAPSQLVLYKGRMAIEGRIGVQRASLGEFEEAVRDRYPGVEVTVLSPGSARPL